MAFDGLNPSLLEQPPVPPVEHLSEEEAEYLAAERKALEEMAVKDAAPGASAKPESPIVEAQVETGSGIDPLVTEIENVLKVDLAKIFKEPLAPEVVDRFVADEKTLAHRIFTEKEKVKPEDMVEWIERWLHQLPGVNKPYLKQEALNKTLAITALLHDGSS